MHTKWLAAILLATMFFLPSTSWPAHPLITDDTGTQGKGRIQLELNGQYDKDKEAWAGFSVESTVWQIGTTFSYGIVDNVDLVLNLPYVKAEAKLSGTLVYYDETGLADISIEAKWRFYEADGLSLAVKPGVVLPTGDEDKGLGAGKTGYHLFIIGSMETAPWAFHANLGYIRNNNEFGEEKNIWRASFATAYEAVNNLKLVGNIGFEKNPNTAADEDPAFLIVGAIYSLSENLDIDAGIKLGLTSAETDMSLMAGLAIRF